MLSLELLGLRHRLDAVEVAAKQGPGDLGRNARHGQNVALKASETLNPAPPGPSGSRYQNWKFQVELDVICPAPEPVGGIVKSI